jgi:hypothetical protein
MHQNRWAGLLAAVCLAILLLSCGGHGAGDSALSQNSTQLAELKSMPAPGGVGQEVWNSLKDELTRVLTEQQSFKRVSAAPLDGRSKVPDLAVSEGGGGSAVFTFSYRNTGDYDQNGIVGLTDLVPLGIHFGKTTASGDWQAAQVADGNTDGVINIADVTPIGQHWQTKVDGYELQVSTAPEPSPSHSVAAEILLGDGAVPGGGGFKHFTYTLSTPASGSYYRVVPFEGAAAARTHGIPSDAVQFSPGVIAIPGNLYATDGDYIDKVMLSWNVVNGATGYKIYRDAQAAPIATVGAVDVYDDTGVADNVMHTYWVKATDGTNDSNFSTPNDGYKGSAFSSTYVVLGWNDLGMHCMNQDFSTLMILPPYNVLHAQILLRGAEPQIVTGGLTVSYEIPGNTTSVTKTNFWTYANSLLGVTLPPDVGLTGNGLSGAMTSLLGSGRNDWSVTGIPITPLNDAMQPSSYALSRISVLQGAALVAETQAVVPVSWEISCDLCHADNMDILDKHDALHGTGLANAAPVLCGNCHAQPELGLAGSIDVPSLSSAMHSAHAPRMAAAGLTVECYACHPGQQTRCLRDVHFSAGMVCNDCHGDMNTVGNPSRKPWTDEPSCGTTACHNVAGHEYEQASTLYRDSMGHNGVHCAACHGSPHAIQETVVPADNVQALALQGHAGKIDTCTVCHTGTPGEAFNHTLGEGGDD